MSRNTDPLATSVWMRRPARSRGGQPPLSRDQIVSAAIALLDADGLDGLSMRRLGDRLAAGATSTYWYVTNKDELLDLAVDEALGEIDVPDPAEVGWRAAAGAYARQYRSAILRHPWMVGLMGVRLTLGPHAIRMGDRLIGALAAAGFTGGALASAASMLTSHTIGSATIGAAMHTASARAGRSTNDLVAEVGPYLRGLQAEYPNYVGWWQENKGSDMEKVLGDAFDFGLERLLDSLEMWLDRTKS